MRFRAAVRRRASSRPRCAPSSGAGRGAPSARAAAPRRRAPGRAGGRDPPPPRGARALAAVESGMAPSSTRLDWNGLPRGARTLKWYPRPVRTTRGRSPMAGERLAQDPIHGEEPAQHLLGVAIGRGGIAGIDVVHVQLHERAPPIGQGPANVGSLVEQPGEVRVRNGRGASVRLDESALPTVAGEPPGTKKCRGGRQGRRSIRRSGPGPPGSDSTHAESGPSSARPPSLRRECSTLADSPSRSGVAANSTLTV